MPYLPSQSKNARLAHWAKYSNPNFQKMNSAHHVDIIQFWSKIFSIPVVYLMVSIPLKKSKGEQHGTKKIHDSQACTIDHHRLWYDKIWRISIFNDFHVFSGSHKGGFKDTGGAATSPSILPVTTDKFQRSHLRNVAVSPAFGGFTTGRCLWCLWCLSLSATLYPIISP